MSLATILIACGILGGISAAGYIAEKSVQVLAILHLRRPRTNLSILDSIREKPPSKAFDALLAYILRDQRTEGPHRGQFGRFTIKPEDNVYDAPSEQADIKPRLWHTGVVLDALGDLSQSRAIRQAFTMAREGLEDLFQNGWVSVGLGARAITYPTASGRSQTIVSYRHSIKAAQICLSLNPASSNGRRVSSAIIDHGDDLQTQSGGWRQCATEFVEEDIYCAAYALNLLNQLLLTQPPWISSEAVPLLISRLQSTIRWLEWQWEDNKWAYGDVRGQDNAALVFAEIAPTLNVFASALAEGVAYWIQSRLTYLYHPGSGLLDQQSITGPASTSIRIAYSLYRYDRVALRAEIAGLAAFAQDDPSGGIIDSAEAAMLIAMLNYLDCAVQSEPPRS